MMPARTKLTSGTLVVSLLLLCIVGIGYSQSPFSVRSDLKEPLGPSVEVALKKMASRAERQQVKFLTRYMDTVVKGIGSSVALEPSESEELKRAAEKVIGAAAKDWQPCIVASVRPLVAKMHRSDKARVSVVNEIEASELVGRFTVQGWMPPDKRSQWKDAVKNVLGEERDAQWQKALEADSVELRKKTDNLLKTWVAEGRKPMDAALTAAVYDMSQVLRLPEEITKQLDALAKALVDQHVVAETEIGAELINSLTDAQLRRKVKQGRIGARTKFARPANDELVRFWQTKAVLLLSGDFKEKWLQYQGAVQAFDGSPVSTIRWNNGESLLGAVEAATADHVTWRTPDISDPITVKWDVLRRIDFPVDQVRAPDSFRFVMRDGSHLYGDIELISETSVAIKSSRHGRVDLKRSELLYARRLSGGNLRYHGPNGEADWAVKKSQKKSPKNSVGSPAPLPIVTVANGGMKLPYWNSQANLDLEIPDRVVVDFCITSQDVPEFQLALLPGNRRRLSIETWDDEVVLKKGNQFQSVLKLGREDRELSLQLYWDLVARQVSVVSSNGEVLTVWDMPEDTGETDNVAGILLKNRGRDLTLKHLCVSEWDGQIPMSREVDAEESYIELLDGRVLATTAIGNSAEGISIGNETVGLDQIESLIFSGEQSDPQPAEMQVIWSDGTLVKGEIIEIQADRMTLKTRAAAAPITASLASIRQILNDGTPEPELTIDKMDTLQFSGHTMRGRLEPSSTGLPRWRFVGSERSVTIGSKVGATFNRAFSKDHDPSEPAEALLYTQYGDILPARISTIDKSGVSVKSGITELDYFDAGDIRAVQFGVDSQLNLSGFRGSDWELVKGRATPSEGKLDLKPGSVFGHGSMMRAREIAFSMNRGTLRVRFNSDGGAPEKSTNYLIGHWGSQVYSGVESSEGQMERNHNIKVENGRAVKMKFLIQDKKIVFLIDGMTVCQFPIDPRKKTGAGVYFEPASLWGNSVSDFSLTDFSAYSPPGSPGLPTVSAEVRSQVLSIPRFLRDDLPSHLLIAQNGDVLRGEIEASTTEHYRFRYGMEDVVLPKERVKAVVWLEKPDPDTKDSEVELAKPGGDKGLATMQTTSDLGYAMETVAYCLASRVFSNSAQAKSELSSHGVFFQGGANVVYDASAMILYSRNTDDNQALIAKTLQTEFGGVLGTPNYWFQLVNGGRLFLDVDKFGSKAITGTHPRLGKCQIPWDDVYSIRTMAMRPTDSFATSGRDWQMLYAPAPDLPSGDGGAAAGSLLGKKAADFKLPMLGDSGEFELGQNLGKVVVLDFWATWCGPCIRSLAELIAEMAAFSSDDVIFLGVNQGQSADEVQQFLEARGWEMPVALDQTQKVGRLFGVEGIPHTVVIGRDGKVAWAHSGYTPDAAKQIASAVLKAIKD